MEPEANRVLHQVVIGGVVLDLVDAIAITVETMEYRRMCLGQASPLLGLSATGQTAHRVQLVFGPSGPFAVECLEKGRAVGDVEIDKGWGLIGNDMGVRHGGSFFVSGAGIRSTTPGLRGYG
jgi:hypothetical protein